MLPDAPATPRPGRTSRHAAAGLSLAEFLILLFLVAILAILAIISYHQAVVQSRVSRAMSDMILLRTAIGLYSVDHNEAPLLDAGIGLTGALQLLTRPHTYIEDLPVDPFTNADYLYLAFKLDVRGRLPYFGKWIVASTGPDRVHDSVFSTTIIYDPTNGASSRGDVVVSDRRFAPR